MTVGGVRTVLGGMMGVCAVNGGAERARIGDRLTRRFWRLSSGLTALTEYSMKCPWNGGECGCVEFPYLRNGLIPQRCEDLLVAGSISLVPLRKVREPAKVAYAAWLAEERAKREAEKQAKRARGV